MLTRNELLADEALRHSKSFGAMIGLAIGDALGDLGRSDIYRQRYGIVTNLYAGAKSTDDTEFAMLTARTLLDCEAKLTTEAVLTSWKKYILAEGGVYERGGRPLYGAVENIRRGILPPFSGIDNVGNNDDGAAMRIAPIGIVWAGNPQMAAKMAAVEAEISHHRDGVWAAQAVAASVAAAMVDAPLDTIIETGLRYIPTDSWLGRAMKRAMTICDTATTIEDAWEPLHIDLWTPSHSASPEALPQIYALLRLTGGDFKRALFWGGNFGRDADTIGAVLGAILGAKGGQGVIPADWVDKVKCPDGVCLKFAAREDVSSLAIQLADLMPMAPLE